MSIRERRIILRRIAIYIISIGSCCILVYYGRIYAPKIWVSVQIVNFLVNSTPTILSILFALFIDKDLEIRTKKRWKIGIVACGIIWSILLWHRQTLADKQSNEQIQNAVNSAVQKSNEHSDQKFAPLQAQVTDLGKNLDVTTKTISSALNKTTTDLDRSIGKVGKPEPPESAKLQFSLWKDKMLETDFPLTSERIKPDKDGSYQIQFIIINASSVKAEGVEMWVTICNPCSYTKEPEGFDRPNGIDEHVRHKHLRDLPPGAAVFDNIINVNTNHAPIGPIAIHFTSTCDNCKKLENTGKFFIIPDVNITPPQ